MNVKTLEKFFNERIDREVGNFVDTVEDRIYNAILISLDSNITPKIELAIGSINASSGQDATSVMVSSECGEDIGITEHFENASERNIALTVINTNDETRNILPDDVSELSVPGTHFDRQPNTHHNCDSHIQTIRKLNDKDDLNFKCSLFEHSITAFEFVNAAIIVQKYKRSTKTSVL